MDKSDLPTHKECRGCHRELPLSDYSPHPTCKFGVLSRCKACNAAQSRNYRHRHRERIRQQLVESTGINFGTPHDRRVTRTRHRAWIDHHVARVFQELKGSTFTHQQALQEVIETERSKALQVFQTMIREVPADRWPEFMNSLNHWHSQSVRPMMEAGVPGTKYAHLQPRRDETLRQDYDRRAAEFLKRVEEHQAQEGEPTTVVDKMTPETPDEYLARVHGLPEEDGALEAFDLGDEEDPEDGEWV